MSSPNLSELAYIFEENLPTQLANVPGGYVPLVISQLLQQLESQKLQSGHLAKGLVYVASDGRQLDELRSALTFFAPNQSILEIPAWDCLPYDRVSPSNEIAAQRIASLGALARIAIDEKNQTDKPLLILTTANALVQRQVPMALMARRVVELAPGRVISMDEVIIWLSSNGFERNSTVRDRGEFAVRGGILDYYAPGESDPVRLDFFGDAIDSIRSFDISSQRTLAQKTNAVLSPMSEVDLNPQSIARFRTRYLELFGAATREDALYLAVSEGRKYTGIEHWLPLFHDQLDSLFDYFSGFCLICDHQIDSAIEDRLAQVQDHFEARIESIKMSAGEGAPYKPVKPDLLYLEATQISAELKGIWAGFNFAF